MKLKMPSSTTTAPVQVHVQVFTTAFVAFLAIGSSSINAFSPMVSTQVNMRQSVHTPVISSRKHMPLRRLRTAPPIMMSKIDKHNFESDAMDRDATPTPTPTPTTTSTTDKIDTKDNTNDSMTLTSMQLMATAAAFALAFMPLQNADAAMSSGRMGGSFRAPRQSMSRPAPMRSSSYSRGGYSNRPGMMMAPSIGYGGGYGYGGGGYATPYFSPFAPAVYGGAGVMAVSRGPSVFDLLFLGGFLFAVSQIFLATDTLESASSSSVDTLGSSALGPGTSVVQLSVALEVSNRDDSNSILSVLNRLSLTAKTDTRVGIQNLASHVALEILRRRSTIVSATTETKHFNHREKALREFEIRSIKERSKFESEAVSKYGGVDYGSSSSSSLVGSSSSSSSRLIPGDQATMAVITLVLAIDGDSTKLNKINSITDVEQALRLIASDSKVSDCLQSAEILWTPEDRLETLSVRDVIADYPELRSI